MAQSANLISVDTEILIWGVQKNANPLERRLIMVPKAKYFFEEYIESNGYKLLIPTCVVAEYLVHLSKSEEEVLNEVLENCLIVDFDYKAARIAAEIWRKRTQSKETYDGVRNCITTDCRIIATAKAHGASAIYTEHDDIIKLARVIGFPTRPLPLVPPKPLNLFNQESTD